jgi:hypothetical protein
LQMCACPNPLRSIRSILPVLLATVCRFPETARPMRGVEWVAKRRGGVEREVTNGKPAVTCLQSPGSCRGATALLENP